MHPAFRKGVILLLSTLAWFYVGHYMLEVGSPFLAWFKQQPPGDKVKVCLWVFIGGAMLVDGVWLTSYGLRQGRIR